MLAVKLCQHNCIVWNYHLGNVMFLSVTFKRQCFLLASMSMPSNTRDRRVSSVLTSRASGYKTARYTSVTLQQQLAKQANVIGRQLVILPLQFRRSRSIWKLQISSEYGLYSGGNYSGVWRQTC